MSELNPMELRSDIGVSLQKILLDEKNKDIIELTDHKGENHIFRQIATIPVDETIYCILKPLTDIGVGIGEAVVFKLIELEKDVHLLASETDEKIKLQIFLVYYQMLSASIKKSTSTELDKSKRLATINEIVSEYKEMLEK